MSDSVLGLIDGAIELSNDAARWTPELDSASTSFHYWTTSSARCSPDGRVPYEALTPGEREAVHAWVRLHSLEPADIPLDGIEQFDESTREWRIRRYRRNADGKVYFDDAGNVASVTLRRVEKAPLPWRCA